MKKISNNMGKNRKLKKLCLSSNSAQTGSFGAPGEGVFHIHLSISSTNEVQ